MADKETKETTEETNDPLPEVKSADFNPGEYLTNAIIGEVTSDLRMKVKTLTDQNKILNVNLKKKEEDNLLMFDHLTKQLDNCTERIALLEKDKENLRKEIEDNEKTHEQEMDDLRQSHYAECDEFEIKISKLKNELRILEEFKENKIRLEKELADTKQELKNEKKMHENDINNLNHDLVELRRKMNEETIHKLNSQKEELMSLQYSNLSTTTKKALYELEEKTNIIQLMNSQIRNLNEKNSNLENENKALKNKIEIFKDNEKLLCKKNQKLTTKIAQSEKVTELIMKKRDDKNKRLSNNKSVTSLSSVDSLPPPPPDITIDSGAEEEEEEEGETVDNNSGFYNNNNNQNLEEELNKIVKENDQLKARSKQLEKKSKERDELLDETALFCMFCLEDIRSTFISYKSSPPAVSDLSREEREHFLNILLERLRQSRDKMIQHSGYGGFAPVVLKTASLADTLHAIETGEMKNLEFKKEKEMRRNANERKLKKVGDLSLPAIPTIPTSPVSSAKKGLNTDLKPKKPIAPGKQYKRWTHYYS